MFDVSLDPSGSSKIYCADAASRRFLYMRLLSDFERFPALHLTFGQYSTSFQKVTSCRPNAAAKETIIYPLIVQEMSREPFEPDAPLTCRLAAKFMFSKLMLNPHALGRV
jgi:hypothetical protein